jgi:hypothetical protein
MKKSVFAVFILLLAYSSSSYCQLAVGYGTDGNTLSLGTSPAKKMWGELRVNTSEYKQADWAHSDRGITQAYFMLNLFQGKNATLYCGGGLGINLLSAGNNKWVSANVPVGLKANPLTKFPELFIFGEYNPMIIIADGVPVIHSVSFGFRYILSKKE